MTLEEAKERWDEYLSTLQDEYDEMEQLAIEEFELKTGFKVIAPTYDVGCGIMLTDWKIEKAN